MKDGRIVIVLILVLSTIGCQTESEKAVQIEEIAPKLATEVENDFETNGAVKVVFHELQQKNETVESWIGDFFRIDIGKFLEGKNTFAFLTYFMSDSTSRVIINLKSDKIWRQVYDEELEMYKELNDLSAVRFEDFTGDGMNEILLPLSLSAANGNSNYYCLKWNDSTFERIPNFEVLTNPQFDQRTNKIHSLHKGGIGNYSASEYQLINLNLKETKRTVSGTAPSEDPNFEYVQVIKTYQISDKLLHLLKIDSIQGLKDRLPHFWTLLYSLNEN